MYHPSPRIKPGLLRSRVVFPERLDLCSGGEFYTIVFGEFIGIANTWDFAERWAAF
jgi:hypothetical protein